MAARSVNGDFQDDLNDFFWKSGVTVDDSSGINTLPTAFTQVSVGEINTAQVAIQKFGSLHDDITKYSSFEAGISNENIIQIATIQDSSLEVGLGDSRILKISSPNFGFLQEALVKVGIDQSGSAQVGDSKARSTEMRISQVSPLQVSTFAVNILEVSINDTNTPQVGTSEFASAQRSSIQSQIAQINSTEISLPSSVTLQQFLSSHNFSLQNTTIPTWTEFLTGTTPFNLNIAITDLPTGQLAEANITHFDNNGRPTSGTLTLDTDANGLGWFIDRPPWDNAEFGIANSATLFRATLGSEAHGRYDLLTTVLHELGHLAGLISGTPTYDDRVQLISGTPTFLGNGYSVALTQDRSHLTDPTKLMSTYLAPGMRKLPSQLELQMLTDIRNSSSMRTALTSSVRQEATPMVGITNGQFDQLLTQWDTRGSIQVTNAAVTLREDDPLLAHLSQTFIIPNGAKTLQFTLTDAYLDQSPLNPGDTFEVALLNAQTLQPLTGAITTLTQTDSLLNLQNSGQLHRTTATYLSDLPDSDDRANAFRLARPRTITIDLTTVPANTLALLSFDLLGFGSQNGYVTINDVRLFTDNNKPIANFRLLRDSSLTMLTLAQLPQNLRGRLWIGCK